MRFNGNIFNDMILVDEDSDGGRTWFLPHDSLLYQALWDWFGYGPESNGGGITLSELVKKLDGKYCTDYELPNGVHTEGIEIKTGSGNPLYSDLIGWNNKYKFYNYLNED